MNECSHWLLCILLQNYCMLIWCSWKVNLIKVVHSFFFFSHKSDTVWCIGILGPPIFERNPLWKISLRKGKEIVLRFVVLKNIILIGEFGPSLAMQAVRNDFIISKELESDPLGVIPCVEIVPSWPRSWQFHWRMCRLRCFYKNNRTHPEVFLSMFFQTKFCPSAESPKIWDSRHARDSWSRSRQGSPTAGEPWGGTLRSRGRPVAPFSFLSYWKIVSCEAFGCCYYGTRVCNSARGSWRGGLWVPVFSSVGKGPQSCSTMQRSVQRESCFIRFHFFQSAWLGVAWAGR